MRVAYFCDTYAPQINGVAMTLERLRQYAANNRIETVFLVPSYPGPAAPEENVHRVASLPLLFYRDCRVAVPPVFKAERILDAFRPDIIHAYSEFTISLAAMRYARKHRIPIVSSFTTDFVTYLHSYSLDFLNPCLEAYLHWFHNSCRCTFCPSERTKAYLQSRNIRHIGIMRRGVDPARFSPVFRTAAFRKAAGAREGAVLFTYVGRISPEKDLDILAESVRRLKARYGEKAAFAVVGDGPYLGRLHERLGNLAHFTGFLQGRALSEAYASSDVFVFPSTSETFGNVVLEAMCSGLPAVVPDAGGAAELVKSGADGFVVAPRNAGAFSEAAARFLEAPGLAGAMGRRALAAARERSWESVFRQLFCSYGELLAQRTV